MKITATDSHLEDSMRIDEKDCIFAVVYHTHNDDYKFPETTDANVSFYTSSEDAYRNALIENAKLYFENAYEYVDDSNRTKTRHDIEMVKKKILEKGISYQEKWKLVHDLITEDSSLGEFTAEISHEVYKVEKVPLGKKLYEDDQTETHLLELAEKCKNSIDELYAKRKSTKSNHKSAKSTVSRKNT